MNSKKLQVCFVSTIAWPLRVYIGSHIRKIAEGCQVTCIADGVSELVTSELNYIAKFRQVAISRSIDLFADLLAVFNLCCIFKFGHFDCVHSIMPKAGLLAMSASLAVGVPNRFHTFTGQVWATRTGLSRRFLMSIDWLIAFMATGVLTVSYSQRDFLIANRIVKAEKIVVLSNGSVGGVDTRRFMPDSQTRARCRHELGIGSDDFIFLFVGRLNREKGISDLLDAFRIICVNHSIWHLLLVGPDEDNYDSYIDNLPAVLRKRICRIGFTTRPEQFMMMSDVICLPSYREGFGSVLIEAAACGLPAIASRIYGISDAVIEEVTGIFHAAGNTKELALCMLRIAQDKSLRQRLASSARARAIECFSEEILTEAFKNYYRNHGLLF